MKTGFFKKKLPIPLWAALIILLGGAYVFYRAFYAAPPGYCTDKHRYLSDLEFIEIALKHEQQFMDMEGSKTVLDYYFRHPECCTVNRNESEANSENTFEGHGYVVVSLFYGNTGRRLKEGKYYYVMEAISPCGAVGEAPGYIVQDLPDSIKQRRKMIAEGNS